MMTTTEKLARQIRRVAVSLERARRFRAAQQWGKPVGSLALDDGRGAIATIDALLERACQAIGSGDESRMTAVGLELEALQ